MKFRFLRAAPLGAVALAFCLDAAVAQQGRVFGPGEPASVEELPAGAFRDALLALEPRARARAMATLRAGNVPANDLADMRVNRQGFLYYVDPLPDEAEEAPGSVAPPSGIPASEVFLLHSKPGSPNTLYVDFDGHILQGTVWNSSSGHPLLDMLPFDRDGSPDTFTQDELDRIAEAWKRVAEDFAPFDVDVTTEEPPYTVLSDGEIYYGPNTAHALVTNRFDRYGNAAYANNAGGVAYLNSWGAVGYATGLSFNSSLTSNAMTISHETGHQLGLHHDGTTTSGYYSGHGAGATSWGPIMGAPFGKSVVTWSRDTYPGANNSEDDYLIIIDDIPFRADDHADTNLAAATPLTVTGGTNVVSTSRVTDPSWADLANKGIIEDQSDIDLFSMNIGAGLINLTISADTWESHMGDQGADLDIEATLMDEFGTVLQTSNPDASLHATINYNATVAGTYYLQIAGVGRGNPLTDGYTDYGIVGQFYINGTIPEDVVVIGPPTAPSDLTATLVGDVDIDLDWTDPATGPEYDEAGYRVYRSIDGGPFGLRASLPRDSSGFSDNNLGNGDYAYYVEVYNSQGTDATAPTAPITVDVPTVAVATSESTTWGSIVSGNFVSTQIPAGAETLREQHNGGKPRNRRSFLSHTWAVTGVTPAAMVELSVTASAPSNAEADDFLFHYSVNGGPWTYLGEVVNGTSSQTMTAFLPSATSGYVHVMVSDSDQNTQGASDLDTVSVSEIKVTSTGDPAEQAPVVTIDSPADGTAVMTGEPVTLDGTADDFEEGDLSGSISWNSDIQGYLGAGASIVANLGEGSHMITASATDSASMTGEDSISVSVSSDPVATDMAVADLDGVGAPNGKGGKWSATVTVLIADDLGAPVPGAIVTAFWSGGASGATSCTTNGAGVCDMSKGGLKNNASSVTLNISSVSGPLPYDPADNGDPDGDSDGNAITVTAP